jgi:hypothetical protein
MHSKSVAKTSSDADPFQAGPESFAHSTMGIERRHKTPSTIDESAGSVLATATSGVLPGETECRGEGAAGEDTTGDVDEEDATEESGGITTLSFREDPPLAAGTR